MKTIRFIPSENSTKDIRPESAKSFVPDWYRRAEITYESEVHPGHTETMAGLKRCIPFLDAMISGFMLLTWTDIEVNRTSDGSISLSWDESSSSDPVKERKGSIGSTIPRPPGHSDNHLVWTAKWGFKLPKGYSALVTHPFNRYDLPFTTMSGLMDSDGFFAHGNIPFFLHSDFEGIIPEGTPFAQILPVKRESWLGVYDPSLIEDVHTQGHTVRSNDAWYKNFVWVRKNYTTNRSKDE